MRALAIIPARGGSKRIPRKNLRLVGGKPLLVWSIEAAQAAPSVDMVVVSSDDQEILSVARQAGAIAQERPAELATDEALTDPVLVHVVQSMAGYRPDAVVLLQPTVPVRRPGLVEDCIAALAADPTVDAVLTGWRAHFLWWQEELYANAPGQPPTWWRTQCPRRPRSQDMHGREVMFHEDGSVYVTRTEALLRTGSRLGAPILSTWRNVKLFQTPRTVDIDTEDDLGLADAMLRLRGRRWPNGRPNAARDRTIATERQAGASLRELAERHGISRGRVGQVLARVERERRRAARAQEVVA